MGYFWKKFSDFNEDGSIKTDVGILLKVKQISSYGNDSYGSMSGRDIMALAAGLYECCNFNYLQERVEQCNYLAEGFYKAGVKGVVLPAGGHGVYINMDEFFDGKRGHETFAGEGFSLELIRRYGNSCFWIRRLFYGIWFENSRTTSWSCKCCKICNK